MGRESFVEDKSVELEDRHGERCILNGRQTIRRE